jgi:hypothetical protein
VVSLVLPIERENVTYTDRPIGGPPERLEEATCSGYLVAREY